MTEPPTVPAEVYTEEYYRHACGPHEDWQAHEGAKLSPYYTGIMGVIQLREGDRLLDLGAGRGELLAASVHAGAEEAVGVEYAEAAIDLAETTLAAQEVEGRARIFRADVRDTGLDSDWFDVVTLLDVVEHLTPDEVHDALQEARRVLKPGGRVVIHTLPNRLVYDVTYRLQRLAVPTRIRSWPKEPRGPYERSMHINEYTLGRLRRDIGRAGFTNLNLQRGRWVLDHFVGEPNKKLYHRLARFRPTRAFGVADLWGFGYKPS